MSELQQGNETRVAVPLCFCSNSSYRRRGRGDQAGGLCWVLMAAVGTELISSHVC